MHLRTDTSAQSHFASVPTISKPRNSFTISKKHLTTIQFDKLFPIYSKYIYPGDTLSVQQKIEARLTTQVALLYDDLYIDLHAWFVPFRLIQTDWARFQFNAQPSGPSQDNSALTTPNIDLTALGTTGFASKSLYDYFEYPTLVNPSGGTAEHINNYPARAYNLIWNTNYRDENLQTAVTVDLDNGPDNPADYVLLARGKRHDGLTSGLPWQQKGTAPTIALGTVAPVIGIGAANQNGQLGPQAVYETTGATSYNNYKNVDPSNPNSTWYIAQSSLTGNPSIFADLASVAGPTVNVLRQTIAVQHLLEADARGGTRDVEAIQHRWGVTVPDFRLQLPEYLGGSTVSLDGVVVPQTSESGTTPQGNLTQFSQTMAGFNVTHSFVEHGVFMILASARSNITYQQGLKKDYSLRTRFDFYQPEFANLGEVAVRNKEIYYQGNVNTDLGVFCYQEYGYNLRYDNNAVTGEFRSNYAQSRDNKHMADDYSSLPTLGSAWIQSNTPISRNIAVSASTADPLELSTVVQGRITRTLPMFSVPGLMRL